MPYVACPSCGERGKIPPTMLGARIKCKKCGLSFTVAPAASKGKVKAAALDPIELDGSTQESEGIAVEGLDAAAWTFSNVPTTELPIVEAESAEHAAIRVEHSEISHRFEAHEPTGLKQYKVLCSRDKVFEGKFDLARLEEVLNDLGRQGWVVKAMSTPHLKDFGSNIKEEVVIILER
jgi:hypothetical protein